MRALLLSLAIVSLGACTQQPIIVQQSFNPEAAPTIGPTADKTGPPADLPTGAAHTVCVTAVHLC